MYMCVMILITKLDAQIVEKKFMTEEKQIDYKQCLYNMLLGLQIEHRDEFMEYADEDDCLLLGVTYANEVQNIINCYISPSIQMEPIPPSSES